MKHVRFLSLLIAMVLCLFLVPAGAEEKVVAATSNVVPEELVGISDDELFAGYVEQKLYGYEWSTFSSACDNLTPAQKAIYDALKAECEKVADGIQKSTSFIFDVANWTTIPQYEKNSEAEAEAAFQKDVDVALDALLLDCPYEMYWYDKVSGMKYWYWLGTNGSTHTLDSLSIDMYVGKPYAGTADFTVNDIPAKVQTAAANAAEIVSDNQSKSDYEKLLAYKEAICDLVTYDKAAADGGDRYFSDTTVDPWQLISVFDGDTNTNVVCEGYSKAFQYLCDLAQSKGGLEDITVFTVTGYMFGGTGGGGGHMWNVVTMEDGKNYIVDVTNSDTESVGVGGELFLGGTDDTTDHFGIYLVDGAGNMLPWGLIHSFNFGTADDPYYVQFNYDYDLPYADSQLKLAASAYVPKAPAVAKVDDTEYTDFATALNAWKNFTDTRTLTLLDDIELTEVIKLDTYRSDKVLDLNGKQLSRTDGQVVLYITSGSINLTIQDTAGNGKIVATADRANLIDSCGILTITGGTFEADNGIAIANSSGTLYISGNTVARNASENFACISNPSSISDNVQIDANVDLSFTKIPDLTSATNCLGWVVENYGDDTAMLDPDEWLPDGCALQIGDEIDYELEKYATATIVTHSTCDFSKWGTGDEEHWKGCACGRTKDTDKHTWGLVDNGDGTHSEVCTDDCGYPDQDDREKIIHTYTALYTDNKDGVNHTAACTCGAERTESHTFGTNDTCACGEQAVASITSGSTVTYYGNFSAAQTAWKTGTTLTLLANYNTDSLITVSGTGMTLDLNGYTIEFKQNSAQLTVAEGAELAIEDGTGNGAIKSMQYTVAVKNNGKLTISGGKIIGNSSVGVENHGTTIVTGATQIDGSNSFWYHAGTIDLRGVTGTAAEGWTVYVSAGAEMTFGTSGDCDLILPANTSLVGKEDKLLTSPVGGNTTATITSHVHVYTHSYTPNDDGTTHTAACTCGAKAEPAAHTFGASDTCVCGVKAVLSLTSGSVVTYYGNGDIRNAVDAWNNADGNTLTLLESINDIPAIAANDSGKKHIILDLNGKATNYISLTDGDLTIKNGTVHSDSTEAIKHTGDNLTLENVTVSASRGDGVDTMDKLIVIGNTTIEFATYDIRIGQYGTVDLSQANNCADWTIYNGEQVKTVGTDIILPDGYCLFVNGKYADKMTAGQTGVVTAHSHTPTYTSQSAANHKKACACGYVMAASEPHSFDPNDNYQCICGATCIHSSYEDGKCTACGLVKTYTLTLDAAGAKIVEINGEAKKVLDGETFTVPHGQELEVKFENTLSTKEKGVDVEAGTDDAPLDCLYDEATNTLTIPANEVTGDIVIYASAYVSVQFELHGGVMTEDGAEWFDELFNCIWNAETSTLKAMYGLSLGNLSEYFQLDGHTFAGMKVDGSEDIIQTLEILSDMTVDIVWECSADALNSVSAKDATCTDEGNIAYFACTCGKLYADAAGDTELTADDVKTDKDSSKHVGMDITTGKCACGEDMAKAKVTVGNDTTYYATLKDALEAAKGNTADVTMLAEGEIAEQVILRSPSNITLNLNGKTITSTKQLDIYNGATLVINGEGNFTNEEFLGTILHVGGGTLIINGGNFTAANDGAQVINSMGGTIFIKGGSFTAAGDQSTPVSIVDATATVTGAPTFKGSEVYGEFSITGDGKLYLNGVTRDMNDWRVSDNATTDGVAIGTNLILPDDSYALKVGGNIVSSLSGGQLGTIVTHTEHTYTYTSDGDTTHTGVCGCGAETEPVPHDFTYEQTGETHTVNCADCEYEQTGVAHDLSDGECVCGATPVAQVDGKPYANFANAVAAWEVDTAETMTLLQDVEYGKAIKLEDNCGNTSYCSHNYSKTLDLNGHTLTSTATGGYALYHTVPLTINDSSSDGTGKFVADDINGSGCLIYSNGSRAPLTLNGGAFSTQSAFHVLDLNSNVTTVNSNNVTMHSSAPAIKITNPNSLTIIGTGCDGWEISNGSNMAAPITIPEGFHLEDTDGNQLEANNSLPAWVSTFIKADHVHSWSYTADDAADTITATCDVTGCPTSNVVVTLPAAGFTYDGSEKSVEPTCSVANSGLEATVAYTGERTNVSEAGFTATMTLGGESVSKVYTIAPASIGSATIADIPNEGYTGAAIEPTVTVTLGDKTLSQGTDFDLVFNNNVNAGAATINVIGKGNYTDMIRSSFTIDPASIAAAEITVADQVYTGTALEPEVIVSLGNKPLALDTDYTVTYANNTNVGEAKVTITGTGNYTGTADKTFQIALSGAVMTANADEDAYTYGESIIVNGTVTATGEAPQQTYGLRAAADQVALYNGDTELATASVSDGEFTLTYNTTDKALPVGTHTLTAKYFSDGNKSDATATVTITLNPAALTATAATGADRAFDGTKEVAITAVTLDGKVQDTDVVSVDVTGLTGTISGADADTYTEVTLPEMTLTGADAAFYTVTGGTIETNVTISPKAVANPTIVLDPATFVYDGNAKEPAVTVKDGETVIPATEYTVSYQNNTDVGTETAMPTVVITDNEGGNYTVSGTKEFAITKSPSAITAKAYLGDTEQYTFTYGDVITVKGSVAADLTASQTYALRMAPINTAYLYWGDNLLAECTMEGNTFTLTHNTTDKLLILGERNLTVEFGGNSNLEVNAAEVTIFLQAATPEVTAPTDLTATYGDTLADVDLPEGWAWNTPTGKVGDAGTQTHKATYTSPVDTDYYNPVTIDVAITVEPLAITGVTAPGDQELPVYCATADEAIAKLPATIPCTDADGETYELPVTWSCDEFKADPEAESEFAWTVEPNENFILDDGVAPTGTIKVTNGKALPVTITAENKEITYNGNPYDVSALFTIDANAGAPTYSIVSNGTDTGAGTLGEDGKTLTITKAGTITIKVNTAANTTGDIPYAAGEATAVLTVNKGTPACTAPTGLTATYGQTLADVTLPEGWTWKTPTDKVGDAGEKTHMAVFTPENTDLYNTVETELTITVSKASVPLEGVAKTYLGDVEEDTFTYGDTITVKVAPVMPMTLALADSTAPVENQMALFYGSLQISAPADADATGTYTMTYLTTDKVLAIGTSDILVKYIGTDNHESSILPLTVTINKAELTVTSITLKDRAYIPGSNEVEVLEAVLAGKKLESDDVQADVTAMRCILQPDASAFTDTATAGTYTSAILPATIPLKGVDAAYYTVVSGGTAIAAEVTITKAAPEAEGTPDFGDVAPGTTLEEVDTTPIEDLFDVPGSVTWVDDPTTPVAPGESYDWVFTPDDTDNYEPVEGSTVIVPAAPPQPPVQPDPVILPTIILPTQAQLVTVTAGEKAEMEVIAINADSYQWYVDRNNGLGWQPIAGANGTSYAFTAEEAADGYRYICRVSNADGTVSSPVFTVEVLPVVIVPPTGDNASLMLWAAMLLVSAAGLMIMAAKRRFI